MRWVLTLQGSKRVLTLQGWKRVITLQGWKRVITLQGWKRVITLQGKWSIGRYKPSPLFQDGFEIPIKAFVQCYNINGIKIFQEKVERVGYPPDGENYTDDSKEISSLLGDDIEEEEDDVTSERGEAGECGSG